MINKTPPQNMER